MWLIRLYTRVLRQLGSDLKVGSVLALANIGLAVAAFAEPILFGRIIDRLTGGSSAAGMPVTFASLLPLIGAWVAFGLFAIGAGCWSRSMPTGCRIAAASPSWPPISSTSSNSPSPSTPPPIRDGC